MPKSPRPTGENHESRNLVFSAFELARQLRITTLLVHTAEWIDRDWVEKCRVQETVIWIAPTQAEEQQIFRRQDAFIHFPQAHLNRIDQINFGLFLAIFNGHITSLKESVMCLAGVAGSNRLDTLVIANPQRDYPWFRSKNYQQAFGLIATSTFGRLLEIALRFASEGREGKPIGTIFVLGHLQALSPHIRQLILNPCKGHARRLRSIHNPDFVETWREWAALDGAFVITPKGVVECAGVYLDARAKGIRLRPGLGARHSAAAAISAKTDAVSIVISESSGQITVFGRGKALFEFDNAKRV